VISIGDFATDAKSGGERILTTGGKLSATLAGVFRPEVALAWRTASSTSSVSSTSATMSGD